jgi:hypothetical protein
VRCKMILGVLAVMGTLARSATVAQAGAGGFVSPLTSFFVCHSINGDDPGLTVDLQSPVFGPDRQAVRIGNGTLACAWAKLFGAGTNTEIDPNPPGGTGPHDVLKCYTISVAKKPSDKTRYTFTDELVGAETNVQASEIRYICAPSTLTR